MSLSGFSFRHFKLCVIRLPPRKFASCNLLPLCLKKQRNVFSSISILRRKQSESEVVLRQQILKFFLKVLSFGSYVLNDLNSANTGYLLLWRSKRFLSCKQVLCLHLYSTDNYFFNCCVLHLDFKNFVYQLCCASCLYSI